jgi:hypothetical protein
MVGLYLHSPMSSWRGAYTIEHNENFTFIYYFILITAYHSLESVLTK